MRNAIRHSVSIAVTAGTVIDERRMIITDLSASGARLEGQAFPEGSRIQVQVGGDTAFAIVRWSEIDRMGVEFTAPLPDALKRYLPAGVFNGVNNGRPRTFGRRLAA